MRRRFVISWVGPLCLVLVAAVPGHAGVSGLGVNAAGNFHISESPIGTPLLLRVVPYPDARFLVSSAEVRGEDNPGVLTIDRPQAVRANVPSDTSTYLVRTLEDSGSGSLRQAIADLNARGDGVIHFPDLSGTITLKSPLPSIVHSAMIEGPGTNRLTLSGGGSSSLLFFGRGTKNRLSGMTLLDGLMTNFTQGAAIHNEGSLVISNCVLSGNTSWGGFGGAVYTDGDLLINSSVLINNRCMGPPGESASGGFGVTGGTVILGTGVGIVFVGVTAAVIYGFQLADEHQETVRLAKTMEYLSGKQTFFVPDTQPGF